MSAYIVCLSIMILIAVILFVSMVLWRVGIHKKISGWCFVVSLVLFVIITLLTSFFEGQEAPHCSNCHIRVDTNYCPDCGNDMMTNIKRNGWVEV